MLFFLFVCFVFVDIIQRTRYIENGRNVEYDIVDDVLFPIVTETFLLFVCVWVCMCGPKGKRIHVISRNIYIYI